MDRYLVYALIDPRDGQIRYIGKSTYGIKRAKSHCYPSYLSKEHTHKGRWIRKLLSLGAQPQISILTRLPTVESLAEAERYWIGYFKSIGCILTNATDGGEGTVGRILSEDTRRKISEGNKGNSNAKGAVRSEETRKKLSIAASRRRWTPEERARIAASLTGKKHSEETRKKMSESRKRH